MTQDQKVPFDKDDCRVKMVLCTFDSRYLFHTPTTTLQSKEERCVVSDAERYPRASNGDDLPRHVQQRHHFSAVTAVALERVSSWAVFVVQTRTYRFSPLTGTATCSL